MVGTLRAAIAALILVSIPVVSQAFGFRSGYGGSSYGSSYYGGSWYGGPWYGSSWYGGPSYHGWGGYSHCVPSYPMIAPWPHMAPAAAAWPRTPSYPSAAPMPAPPSRGPAAQTQEPPRAEPEKKRAPIVNESRSLGGEYVAKKALDKNVCKVGFWNATGRDVQLVVDGQMQMLPRDREIRLNVPRTFAWQVDDGRPKNEQVPTGQSTFEVVIRPVNDK